MYLFAYDNLVNKFTLGWSKDPGPSTGREVPCHFFSEILPKFNSNLALLGFGRIQEGTSFRLPAVSGCRFDMYLGVNAFKDGK